jgi:hypothetical protein
MVGQKVLPHDSVVRGGIAGQNAGAVCRAG